MPTDIGDVKARVTLDTTAFDAGMKGVRASVEPTARAIEGAAKRAAAAQATAAKYAADTVTEQGKRIVAARLQETQATKDFQNLQKNIKQGYLDEASGSSAAVAAIQRQVAARKELAAAMAMGEKAASHGGFSDQMAASAAVRSLSGNAGIRSVERFLTVIPGVGAALRTIFPLIGAAGLAGLFFDLGEKGYEAFQKIQNAATATQSAFQDIHDHASVTNDDLAIENQHIQDQIDKLSGHPNNGLADALLEAKKMADQLVVSLQEDRKQLQALLNDNSTGELGTALELIGIGPNATGKQEKEMLKDQQDLLSNVRAAKADLKKELAAAPDATAQQKAVSAYDQSIRAIFQGQIDSYNREAQRLKDTNQNLGHFDNNGKLVITGSTNAQKIANVEGRAGNLEDLRDRELLDESIYAGNQKLGPLKQNKDEGKKAAEKQMKGFEDLLAKRKQDEQLGVVDEINFWEAMLVPAQKYADNVREINEKLGTLNQEYYRQLDQMAAKAVQEQKRAQQQMQQQDAQMLEMMKRWEEQDSRRATAQAKLAEAQERSADATVEQALKFQVMTGALSRHDAAVQLAAIHAADYRAQLEELDREAAEDATRSTLTQDERDTREADRQIRRVDITGAMNRTSAQDQQNIGDTTLLGGAQSALEDFTAAALDSARQMHEFVSNTLNEMNGAILGNQRGRFKQAGGQVLMGGARSLLQEAEGRTLKALGIGGGKKPAGTASDPLYVMLAKMGIGGGSARDIILNSGVLMHGGTTSSSGQAGGWRGIIGGILKTLTGGGGASSGVGSSDGFDYGSILGFADGTGPLTANTTAIVGERGPELVNLPRGASVTPNHELSKMGGDTHVYNIDASGSTDPAQTVAQIHRVMQSYIPGIVGASVKAGQSQAARKPLTAR